MPAKIASIISAVVTAILVILLAIFFGFGGIVLLNGFMDGSAAVATGFICLGVGVILCAILAWALAKTFIAKFNWKQILAVVVSVFLSTILGGGIGFISMMLMIVVAEST
jgi:hypothetical protein